VLSNDANQGGARRRISDAAAGNNADVI